MTHKRPGPGTKSSKFRPGCLLDNGFYACIYILQIPYRTRNTWNVLFKCDHQTKGGKNPSINRRRGFICFRQQRNPAFVPTTIWIPTYIRAFTVRTPLQLQLGGEINLYTCSSTFSRLTIVNFTFSFVRTVYNQFVMLCAKLPIMWHVFPETYEGMDKWNLSDPCFGRNALCFLCFTFLFSDMSDSH